MNRGTLPTGFVDISGSQPNPIVIDYELHEDGSVTISIGTAWKD